ncbi:hypothetical protein ACIPC1_11515 [Streptomyces sp. NPDC087263]|uniref:hypothetical protein n=1 Tax=Streptomyces sp. NPDC087263 TaxID=3365773 RepID=UPI003822E48E
MHPVLCGLAANPALPAELIDRLIAIADIAVDSALALRPDLSHAQVVALASRADDTAVQGEAHLNSGLIAGSSSSPTQTRSRTGRSAARERGWRRIPGYRDYRAVYARRIV